MSLTIWFDPTFGASGDMILGTLSGLGADLNKVQDQIQYIFKNSPTPLPQLSIRSEQVDRCSMTATRAIIEIEAEDHQHRSWSSIEHFLAAADSDTADSAYSYAIAGARKTFQRLAHVEAAIHNCDVEQVHFHEVGATDAIIDIVGTWLALAQLAPSLVLVGPVGIGHGTVESAHGTLPLPAPATAALLVGAQITPLDAAFETVTPTGAALLTCMADDWGPIPAGSIQRVGRGAGNHDSKSHPNVLSGYVISQSESQPQSGSQLVELESLVLLSTNLDDVTGETLGYVIDLCLSLGANDAWVNPLVMKKGRPGSQLNILCDKALVDQMSTLVMSQTGTLGIREQELTRHTARRKSVTVTVEDQPIRVKIGPFGAKAEHDDLIAAAEKSGIAIPRLAQRALSLAQELTEP